jgi:hypothetical protein
LPEGAATGALAASWRLESSPIDDSEGGFVLESPPPAVSTSADGALGSASIRNPGATSGNTLRRRSAAPRRATAGPRAPVPVQAPVPAIRGENTFAAGEALRCALEASVTLSEPRSSVVEENVLLASVPLPCQPRLSWPAECGFTWSFVSISACSIVLLHHDPLTGVNSDPESQQLTTPQLESCSTVALTRTLNAVWKGGSELAATSDKERSCSGGGGRSDRGW